MGCQVRLGLGQALDRVLPGVGLRRPSNWGKTYHIQWVCFRPPRISAIARASVALLRLQEAAQAVRIVAPSDLSFPAIAAS